MTCNVAVQGGSRDSRGRYPLSNLNEPIIRRSLPPVAGFWTAASSIRPHGPPPRPPPPPPAPPPVPGVRGKQAGRGRTFAVLYPTRNTIPPCRPNIPTFRAVITFEHFIIFVNLMALFHVLSHLIESSVKYKSDILARWKWGHAVCSCI